MIFKGDQRPDLSGQEAKVRPSMNPMLAFDALRGPPLRRYWRHE